MKAYLVLITWPDGTEGLLFPRPGNVAIADTEAAGHKDFEKAKNDLIAFAPHSKKSLAGTAVRLVEFERGPELSSFTLKEKE
jgi:hypothetical protein